MSKFIEADLLRKEIEKKSYEEQGFRSEDSEYGYRSCARDLLAFIDYLQQEQPSEICSRCIHHGKDDDYCYNPHGGMRRLINENGVYECTGFCEQEQPEVDLEKEIEEYWSTMGWNKVIEIRKFRPIARYFYGLGQLNSK